ncbi:methionine ABC transporter permease [Pimelobacter simplex]|uniref:ABC transporter permease n=2 Tax=Nocardioides simplex TaxID=2045 RepID=A0A0A1DLH5_NOCSI|nr:methionine ABC transporter permease [Pimelobacter simplex]AIY18271.1 Methionine ABC transporter permease protein [Pimelobacter simplex]KAB2810449.1 ABC transporter permease [Pimelobacter simplex]GEB15896.1 ABC transporter permease [Pimelobacter simplex]SFN12504.1 ABC-type methionine transport system, permease component [Pimelobacter simplex]
MTVLLGTPWPDVPDLLLPALGETLRMVAVVMGVVVLVGGPLGVLIFNTSPLGLTPHRLVHVSISWIANLGRSLPFLVLMAAVIPVTKLVFGTTIGFQAALIPMSIAGIAFFARLTENAVREVPRELLDVGLAGGSSKRQIMTSIQLTEALPGLAAGLTLNVIAMIEYSAIAGAIGSGGVGYLAVNYGYRRFDDNIMIACIVLLVALVQLIQFSGDRIVRALTH